MIKKILALSIIVITIALFTIGCSKEKVKLEIIKNPDEITIEIYDKDTENKLNDLKKQIKDLENKGASREEKRKVLQEVSKLANKSSLDVRDKEFIENLISEIHNLEGDIVNRVKVSSNNNLMFQLVFTYYSREQGEGYLSEIEIFSDGTTLVHELNKDNSMTSVLIKTSLSKDSIKYIEDYYNSKK